MRIAIAGAVLAGAILLDFGAIAQTGDTMSPQPDTTFPRWASDSAPAAVGGCKHDAGTRQDGRCDAEAGRAPPQE
jgi:hypothetical protein